MRLLSVVGDASGVLRCAALARVLAQRPDVEHVVVHTGTAETVAGPGSPFRQLDLPAPDRHLGVAPGSHAAEIGAGMVALEPVLRDAGADVTVVYGDGNAAVAGALVAAGLGGVVAHVDAGLRCGDWSSPDEVNRATTDRVTAFLFAPSRDALQQLALEGVAPERVHFVGSALVDTVCWALPRAQASDVGRGLGVHAGRYVVALLEGLAKGGDPETAREVLTAIERVATKVPVLCALGRHARHDVETLGWRSPSEGCLVLLEPPPYVEMTALVAGAAAVLTDTNDLQEETTFLGVPCVTVGTSTARPVTCLVGTNRLVPPRGDALVAALERAAGRRSPARPVIERWDGHAAERMAAAICDGARVDDVAMPEPVAAS